METIINIFALLGSLGLFLFGMKIMSEGLEKFAGERLRSILAWMTKNRFMGVLTGVTLTALIQSSSATTVMVVSFVNAGLMTLSEAIGVIMGANIGTTVTAWIITAVGFKVDIAAFAIPLLAVGMPLIFSSKGNRKNLGEFIFGFSLLFLGLEYLKINAEGMHVDTIVSSLVTYIPCDSFFGTVLFVILGAVITMVVQSSSAAMAITLMLLAMDIPGFGFVQAAALAMGQNIGTTITAFMASLAANTQARRAAMAHLLFNVIGVLLVMPVFTYACDGVTYITTELLGRADDDTTWKLSTFHTLFNLINTCILIGFVAQIEKLVCLLVPQKEAEEEYRLQYISAGMLSTAELSIMEAQKEINSYAERCNRMVGFVNDLMKAEKDDDFNKIFSRIEKYENITDNMEVEIANYLHKVSEGRLSIESKMEVMRMLRQITELESIGDSCYNLARTLNRHRQNCTDQFTELQLSNMHNMLDMVSKAMQHMASIVEAILSGNHVDYNTSYNLENEINNYRRQLKNRNLQDVDAKLYSYQLGVFYIDFISECEKLGDYILNVVQATKAEKM
ncbi:MAG: Na/Pi cotransporter family protein [Bacteroidaceae bacterium]|nr:Na/Pi cotransporter family protein [Bacteroidaceae bacterium]